MGDAFPFVEKVIELSQQREPADRPQEQVQPVRWDDVNVEREPSQKPADIQVDANVPHYISAPNQESFSKLNNYWSAYADRARHAQASHHQMVAGWSAVRNVRNHPQLTALDFAHLEDNEDIETVTDRQEVPRDNGVTVGSQFNDGDELVMNEDEENAVYLASHERASGRGTIQQTNHQTTLDENRLRAVSAAALAQVRMLEAASAALSTATVELQAVAVAQATLTRTRELDDIHGKVEIAKSVVTIVTSIATAVAHAASGNVADTVEQAGVFLNEVTNLIGNHLASGVEEKIAQLKLAESTLANIIAASRFEEARLRLEAGVAQLGAARENILIVLGERRGHYQDLGDSVSNSLSDHSPQTRNHVAGMVSAIPLVQAVVGAAAALEGVHVPPYNADAGRGLRLAMNAKHPSAPLFLNVCDELITSSGRAAKIEQRWQKRLDQLFVVKRTITGRR